MNLARAFRSGAAPRLAFVGAGGKTTALFQLAREMLDASRQAASPPHVLVTTTAHLGTDQLGLADHHWIARGSQDLAGLEQELHPGVTLVSGPAVEEEIGRVSGVGVEVLEGILALVQARQLPLLLEADGSRMRPLKAPADHEPPLPGFVDHVVVVAGLSALGRPLHPDWVHRPERFAALSEIPLGETITVEALSRVLTHPLGGLKNIPQGARRIALLNQADTADLRFLADPFAQRLLPAYDSVVLAALHPTQSQNGESHRMDAGGVFSVHEPVAGIILAAGAAVRYGQPKQLLPWQGEPLVRRVASAALQAGLSPVAAVTGAYADQVGAALKGLEVQAVHNPHWKEGQSTSLRAGLRFLPVNTGAAVFLLADQPQISPDLIRALAKMHAETLSPLVAPLVGGRRANPVLFDRDTFQALMVLQGDVGGRGLFAEPDRYPVAWLPWEDDSLLLDVDTPEDYQRLLERKA